MSDGGSRWIHDREVSINIKGYFMPTHERNAPVLLGMPGTDDLFVVVFSTEENLAALLDAFQIEYEGVAVVTNGRELLDEIEENNLTGTRPYRIRVAVDPYRTEEGHVRFIEAVRREVPSDC